MTYLRNAVMGICAVFLLFPVRAFAGNANIVVDNRTGDNLIQVEVFVDGTSCVVSSDTGFKYSLDMKPGVVQVAARVINDIYGYYTLDYEPQADITRNEPIHLIVSYSEKFGDEGEEFIEALEPDQIMVENPEFEGFPDTGIEEIDLSGGSSDTGTLFIQCNPVYAFDEVVLTLTDESYQTYRIPLHMDPYFFRARVTLPVGKYRETGIPEITFNASASRDPSLSYTWDHTTRSSFGCFYDVLKDKEISADDLVIKTIKNGTIMDTDSRYYFSKRTYEEESRNESETAEEFRKKTYQNLVNDETTAQDVQKGEHVNTKNILYTAGIIFIIILIILGLISSGILLYRQYIKNNKRY